MNKWFSNKLSFLLLLIFFLNESKGEVIYADSLLIHAKSLADSNLVSQVLRQGYTYLDNRNDLVRKVAILSLKKSKEIGFRHGEAESHVLLGRVYRRMAWYDKAVLNYISALKVYELSMEHDRIASVCQDLAIIHMNLKEYAEVLRFGKRALAELKQSGSQSAEGKVKINNLIGGAYFELKKTDSAEMVFNTALELAGDADYPEGIAQSLENLSKVYRVSGKTAKATEYIDRAIAIRSSTGNDFAMGQSLSSAAQLYMDNGDFKKASVLLRQAKVIADSIQDIELTIATLQVLYQLYKRTEKFKEALLISEKLKAHEDSSEYAEKNKKIKELETLYQTERSENENIRLKKENSLKEVDLLNVKLQQRTMTVVVFFLLVMAVVIVITLYRQNLINQRLAKLNAEKNNIMAVLSHDLKSPFTRLHTYLQQFEIKLKDEESRESIHRMKDLIHESSEMIQNLLDVTYLEERKVNVNKAEIDLYETAMMLLDGFRPSANRKNITLSLSVEVSELVFHTDPQKFKRIIDNLLSNAIKYSNFGKRVFLSITNKDNGILIGIKDEGQGMDEEDMEVLFTKFARLKSVPTGGESSTGMGLYIVKKLCESLSGKVWCNSSLGNGTTFFVFLPQLTFTDGESETGSV